MATAGFPHPWSQSAGGRVGFHLSSAVPVRGVGVVSLDGAKLAADWRVQEAALRPEVQKISRGSYLIARHDSLAAFGPVSRLTIETLLVRPQDSALLRLGALRVDCKRDALCFKHGDTDLFGPVLVPIAAWVLIDLGPDGEGRCRLQITGGDRLAPVQIDLVAQHPWPAPVGDFVLGAHGADSVSADARFARPALTFAKGSLAWHFPTRLPEDLEVPAMGAAGVPLSVVNLPTFSVRSRRWDGTTFDPRLAAAQYDAIHTHCDDMGAFDWPETHALTIPADATPGVYALQLETEAGTERIPFFVRNRHPARRAVVMLPTATYLAYLNEALPPDHFPWLAEDRGHHFVRHNGLLSLYDFHEDHSGCSITSTRKPLATLRDDYFYPLCGSPHLLPVDLHLLRFLRDQGVDFDLITDHDLHQQGAAALHGYDVLITGSHPEYMSVEMEAAIAELVARGGSLAYLGGNGFAGAVAFRDDLMELRRGPVESGRTWDGPLAEQALSLTGEPGGYLRNRGRGEFALVGGAISLMGFSTARPFARTADSHAPETDWLFAGVAQEEFGDYGIVLGGAAGYELDATDPHMGTHPDTRIIATSEGFPDDYSAHSGRWYPGGADEARARRRAEMTFRALPGGGMIFSASSVAWCGALPELGAMNDVGRITMNFLARALVRATPQA